MSIALIFEVLLALFKFPAELSAFVRLISKTPEERRAEIVKQVNEMIAASETNPEGRPKWEN